MPLGKQKMQKLNNNWLDTLRVFCFWPNYIMPLFTLKICFIEVDLPCCFFNLQAHVQILNRHTQTWMGANHILWTLHGQCWHSWKLDRYLFDATADLMHHRETALFSSRIIQLLKSSSFSSFFSNYWIIFTFVTIFRWKEILLHCTERRD